MTNEKKIELISNINKSLKPGKLTDYSQDEVDAYLSILAKLNPATAGVEKYYSVEEIYEAYTKKIEKLNNMDVVEYVVNHASDEEFMNDAENYKYVKIIYDGFKSDHAKFSKILDNLNEKNKANPDDKKIKEEKYHYMNVVKDVEVRLEKTKKEYDECLKKVKIVGNKSFDKTRGEYQQVLDDAKVYEMIHKDITGSKINTNTVNQALESLKEAYGTYRNNHSIFGRMFRWISITSAAKDYKDFCDVRDAFKNCVGDVINMEDVNAYLDNKINLETLDARQADSIAAYNKRFTSEDSTEQKNPAKKDNIKNEEAEDKALAAEQKNSLDMSGEIEEDNYTDIDEFDYSNEDENEITNEVGNDAKELGN